MVGRPQHCPPPTDPAPRFISVAEQHGDIASLRHECRARSTPLTATAVFFTQAYNGAFEQGDLCCRGLMSAAAAAAAADCCCCRLLVLLPTAAAAAAAAAWAAAWAAAAAAAVTAARCLSCCCYAWLRARRPRSQLLQRCLRPHGCCCCWLGCNFLSLAELSWGREYDTLLYGLQPG